MRFSARLGLLFTAAAALCAPALAQVRYVDASAPPGGNGASWATAYARLQDALAVASSGEVRIAAGQYTPAAPGGPRSATFAPVANITIRGGYVGGTGLGPTPDTRDPAVYRTILSGDLNNDDGPGFTNRADNVYHVLTLNNRTSAMLVDGVTIRGGNADGPTELIGGGVVGLSCSAQFVSCTFQDNSAFRAGGVYTTLTNAANGAPRFRGCFFIGNRATDSYAGALYSTNASSRVPMSLVNCVFRDNTAFIYAGAFFIDVFDVTMINCLVAANAATGTATSTAGGGQMTNGAVTIMNSAFADNTAAPGWAGGLVLAPVGFPAITNAVFWNNTGSQIVSGNTPTVTYCDVQGGFAGVGNINADPLFRDPTNRDYALGAGSPAINAGNTNAFVTAAAPLLLVSDLAGGPRYLSPPDAPYPGTGVGGPPVIDMGAYEYAGRPVCTGDINGDGIVSFADLSLLLNSYGATCPP